jgi:hypothetical protein
VSLRLFYLIMIRVFGRLLLLGRSYKLGHSVGAVLPPVITRALRPVTTGASGADAPTACSGEIVNRAGRCAGPGS